MVPIKRRPCCNQCTEALGPICYYINLELMEHTQHKYTHSHPNTFLPTVLTLSGRPLNSRTHACMHAQTQALEHKHTRSWQGSQPTRPKEEHNTYCLQHRQVLMRSLQFLHSCLFFHSCALGSDLLSCHKF